MEPLTAPFCTFRSRLAFKGRVDAHITYKEIVRKAARDTAYCKSHIESEVPRHLLDTLCLEADVDLRRAEVASVFTSRQTALHVQHGSTHLLLHCAGEGSEQLLLRTVSSLRGICRVDAPGFTANNEAPVTNLLRLGPTPWHACSHILAQSHYEVRYYRSADLKCDMREDRRKFSFILDPIERYLLPSRIAALSVAHGTVNAQLLTDSGHLHLWTPDRGMYRYSEIPLLSETYKPEHTARIECTLHPQVSLFSSDEHVFSHDRRSSHPIKLYAAQYPVTAIKQSMSGPFGFFEAHRGLLSRMDVRYCKAAVDLKPTPIQHTSLGPSFMRGSNEVFVGFSQHSRQVLVHTTSMWDQASWRVFPDERTTLLNCTSPLGNHCSEWAMDGFPVVDRASLGETLTGAALVPVPESSETSTNQCYMLCQQSSSGCVYAQLVLPADRDSVSAPVQLNLPIGVRCVGSGREGSVGRGLGGSPSPGFNLYQTVFTEDLKASYPLHSAAFMPLFLPDSIKKHKLDPIMPFNFGQASAASELPPSKTWLSHSRAGTLFRKKRLWRVMSAKCSLIKYKRKQMLLAHDDLHVPGLSAADFETFLSAFQNAIGEGARTRLSLWEALKLALNSCGKLTSAQDLRRKLSDEPSVEEFILEDPGTVVTASDGLTAKGAFRISPRHCKCGSRTQEKVEDIDICEYQDCVRLHLICYRLTATQMIPLTEKSSSQAKSNISSVTVERLKKSWSES